MPENPAHGEAALPTAPFTFDAGDAATVTQLAFHIANRAVVEDIESYAVKQVTDGRIYWDTRPMLDTREHAPQMVDMAAQALQYAIGAGLVGLHPQRPYLVTIHGRN